MGKKNHATSWDKNIMQALGSKKSRNLSGQKKQKKKKRKTQPLGIKKSRNLSGQKNHSTSCDKKNHATSQDKKSRSQEVHLRLN